MSLKATFYPNLPFRDLYIPHIYKEVYFDKIYAGIFEGKKDMVIIDVGANIGIITRFMRDFAKTVYSIEPSPENFEALKKNVEFNEWDNVIPFNFALADKDGKANFNIWLKNRTGNSLVYTHGGGAMRKVVKVDTKRFDTFFTENNIGEVDFVKLDVEGAEDMILYSDGFKNIADKIKSIMIEFHFSRSDKPRAAKLIKHVTGFGFKEHKCAEIISLFTR